MQTAIPLISGGIGLLSQSKGNHAAEDAANQANQRANAVAARQTALYDSLLGIAKSADQAGAFDPNTRIASLQKTVDHDSALSTGNAAGAARTLGYHVGDSAPLQQINSINSDYKLKLGQTSDAIRQQATQDKLSAYGAAEGALGGLSGAESVYGNQAQQAYGRMQNPAGILSAVSPYLAPGQRSAAGPLSTSSPFDLPGAPLLNRPGYFNTGSGRP